MDKQEQLHQLEKNYLNAFLAFAIKKINSYDEAEELAQEICYQCVIAIEKGLIRDNYNAFIWSIAHNTFKNWCRKKSRLALSLDDDTDIYSNIITDIPVIEKLINNEECSRIRLELSRLWGFYRETLVYFYYDELTIHEIALKLNITDEMVKFYLRAGKQKLKEAATMNVGNKSFQPSEFSIYKSAIDFSKVNVWEVFKRKLPCQIALFCHDSPRLISDISIEVGTPAVYIEDEIQFLLESGVMIKVNKNKYRTNFHILKANAVRQVKEQFEALYIQYVPAVLQVYEKYLPRLKNCDVFRHYVPDYRYAWLCADCISAFEFEGVFTSDGNFPVKSTDFPQILSCGSHAFIFAEEAKGSLWGAGQTPTELDDCVVWVRDVVIFGEYHHQKELRHTKKAQALYDVYRGNIRDEDALIYAQLIEEGYLTKAGEKLFCNVMVSTQKSRKLFEEINAELKNILHPHCKEVANNIRKIVKATIPEQLNDYIDGFTSTWISFYSGVYFREALYNNGFLAVPEKNDNTPIACYVYER